MFTKLSTISYKLLHGTANQDRAHHGGLSRLHELYIDHRKLVGLKFLLVQTIF